MACEAGYSILAWLEEFYNMCLVGIIYFSFGSFGNSVECKSVWKPVVGCLFVLLLMLSPFLLYRKDGTANAILYAVALILGIFTASMHLGHAATLFFSAKTMEKIQSFIPKFRSYFSGSLFAEMNVKQAAARKLAMMVVNALELKSSERGTVLTSHYGQALKNYARLGKKYVRAGGFVWAWQRIVGQKQLFARDGIWLLGPLQ